jgi:hypothetical protein
LAGLFTHVIGFDGAPFGKAHRGDVLIVGAVYATQTLVGVISGKVRGKKEASMRPQHLAADNEYTELPDGGLELLQ